MVQLTQPYIPGFLAFREVDHLLALLERLRASRPELVPDVIFVDGNGVLHPRGFGLASHLGVLARIPTVGLRRKRGRRWREETNARRRLLCCWQLTLWLNFILHFPLLAQIGIGKQLHLVDGLDKKECGFGHGRQAMRLDRHSMRACSVSSVAHCFVRLISPSPLCVSCLLSQAQSVLVLGSLSLLRVLFPVRRPLLLKLFIPPLTPECNAAQPQSLQVQDSGSHSWDCLVPHGTWTRGRTEKRRGMRFVEDQRWFLSLQGCSST